MEYYNEIEIKELVSELHAMCQDDADDIASEINRKILGVLCPYSDGDELIAEDRDTLVKAEDLVARYNK